MQVSTTAFRDALTAAMLVTGKDRALPVLCAVQVERRGAELIVRGTDRYRLAIVTVGDVTGDDGDWTVLLDRDDVTRILKAIPKLPARMSASLPVTVTLDGDSVSVSDVYGSSITVRCAESTVSAYPKIDGLVPTATAPVESIGFNTAVLADLNKMPGMGTKHKRVELIFSGPNRPVRAEWSDGDTGAHYVTVIMPMRLH
jgi:DNA polymerase III sliding clamp (beta) subunit (PCNA family)